MSAKRVKMSGRSHPGTAAIEFMQAEQEANGTGIAP
jgi:hypothetical protein